ncbi:hypothetical protein BJ878DRAFT_482166 [Calycina marina]|uniref:Zinc finger PHD-type domain-containing protein n=1 Tax=Calycina marina TaxID=1763456 RepID=A0A9P7YYY3_9HELO|nr:hypothetical protein BJ878DRAFT_482166 [Calycina marina]
MEVARRSSRASRTSQPLPGPSQSSTPSSSSGRADRATRSNLKTESPRKATPSGSLSSEPVEDKDGILPDDTIQTRRKRGCGDDNHKFSKSQLTEIQAAVANGTEEVEEDDGTVRCICALDEYPGPPQLDEENGHGVKKGIEEPLINPVDSTEDLAGFFLQCDVCKVWQHGGCVGIMNEKESPEEYFCEQCRKDLHRIYTAPNGQRYSHYLPLYESRSRATSRGASFPKDGTRSPRGSKNGRLSSSAQSAKRRSTMNSRDAAYDEEEELRRAIEASKGQKSEEGTEGSGSGRGKRGRSDSEEYVHAIIVKDWSDGRRRKPECPKRQRTTSASPSPSRKLPPFTSFVESEDASNVRTAGGKKIRGAAARNHKEKAEREERERLRIEAKKKREGRAERRRVDEPEPAEEEEVPINETTKTTITEILNVQTLEPPILPSVVTPIIDSPPVSAPSTSHKKGGRPLNARKGKLGKNQFTKDRDAPEAKDRSPGRSQSRDVTRGDECHSVANSARGSIAEPKPAKKHAYSRVSFTDMNRRVTGIMDFIARTQVELAGEAMSVSAAAATGQVMKEVAGTLSMIQVKGNGSEHAKTDEANGEKRKEFNDLSCVEMMDVLTRQLVKWQKEYT